MRKLASRRILRSPASAPSAPTSRPRSAPCCPTRRPPRPSARTRSPTSRRIGRKPELALREFFAAAAGQTTAVRKALAGVAQSRGRGEPSKFASTVNGSAARTARISCVVCAYNEADRIRRILDAVHDHPALAEVIVVNDGSTDDTRSHSERLPRHPRDLLYAQPRQDLCVDAAALPRRRATI